MTMLGSITNGREHLYMLPHNMSQQPAAHYLPGLEHLCIRRDQQTLQHMPCWLQRL